MWLCKPCNGPPVLLQIARLSSWRFGVQFYITALIVSAELLILTTMVKSSSGLVQRPSSAWSTRSASSTLVGTQVGDGSASAEKNNPLASKSSRVFCPLRQGFPQFKLFCLNRCVLNVPKSSSPPHEGSSISLPWDFKVHPSRTLSLIG